VGGSFHFGARTAWHRFEAGGGGSLRLSASSSYDVMRVLAPLTLGTYTRFEVRGKRQNPRRTDRCITATGSLIRC
jgi:hypothetical protein